VFRQSIDTDVELMVELITTHCGKKCISISQGTYACKRKSWFNEYEYSVVDHKIMDKDIIALYFTDDKVVAEMSYEEQLPNISMTTDDELAIARQFCEKRLNLTISNLLDTSWGLCKTFFWANLKDDNLRLAEKNFKRISNNGYKKFIVPMNIRESHWTVMMVDLEFGEITYYDPLEGHDTEMSTLYMEKVKDFVESHLQIPISSFKDETDLPFQKDGYNCGVWVYMRVRKLCEGKEMKNPDKARHEIREFLNKYRSAATLKVFGGGYGRPAWF